MSIIRIDPSFDRLVPRDARIEKVAGGFTFTEGPLWRPGGALWFSDVVGNVVRQWSPDGTVKELLRPGGYDGHSLPAGGFIGPNGMTAVGLSSPDFAARGRSPQTLWPSHHPPQAAPRQQS